MTKVAPGLASVAVGVVIGNSTTTRVPLPGWETISLRPPNSAARDVRFFEMAERGSGAERRLHLDGLIFHSSLAVRSVEIAKDGDAAIVVVNLTLAGKGLSGSFVVDIPLGSGIERVLFGPGRQQIWPAPSNQ